MLKFKTINGVITTLSDGNMAYHAGDTTHTDKNRSAIAKVFGAHNVYFPTQIHSADVIKVNYNDAIQNGDAVISNDANCAIGIVVADCVPILLYDKTQKAIGAVHAGWRGTAGNIVIKTVLAMQKEFGSKACDIMAGIGPSIKGCCYEVGADTASQLGLGAKQQKVDLQELNITQLNEVGVQSIEVLKFCTSCDDRFFSYRKDSLCGRFAAIIRI